MFFNCQFIHSLKVTNRSAHFKFLFLVLISPRFLALLQMAGNADPQEEAIDLSMENGYLSDAAATYNILAPFVPCNLCGKLIAKKALRIHSMVHTGERRYSCDICGTGFMKKGDLNRHSRTHTGERPFKCTLCHRAFNRKYLLRDHVAHSHKEENSKTWKMLTQVIIIT